MVLETVAAPVLILAGLIGLTAYYLIPSTRKALKDTFTAIVNWVSAPEPANTIRQVRTAKDALVNELASTEGQESLGLTKDQAYSKAATIEIEYKASMGKLMSEAATISYPDESAVEATQQEVVILALTNVISDTLANVVTTHLTEEQERIEAGVEAPAIPAAVPGAPAAPAIPGALPDVSGAINSLAMVLPFAGTMAFQALLTQLKTWGCDTAKSTQTCWGTTAANMLSLMAAPLITEAMLLLPDKWSPLKLAMDMVVDSTFTDIFNAPELQHHVAPEEAEDIAKILFKKATELGVKAQLISATVESFSPAKSLGFGYLAAFLGDMAGFAQIGGAMMGVIETQALARPFGYYVNNKVRSMLPDIRAASELYGDRNITKVEFEQLLAYNNLAPGYEAGYEKMSFRPVSYFMLRAMADAGMYDEQYAQKALEHATYNDATILKMKEMLMRMSQGELKTLFTGSALKRFKDGQDTEAQLTDNLSLLGVRDELIPKYIYAAKLEVDHDLWLEAQKEAAEKMKELQPVMLSTAIKRYKEGIDTASQFTEHLTFLGIDPRLLPRYTYAAQLEYDYDYKLDVLKVLKTAYNKDIIGDDEFLSELGKLGLQPERVEAFYALESLRRTKAPGMTIE